MTIDQPTSLNCPACGAPLDVDGTSPVVRCNFCGNTSLLPNTHPSQAAGPVGAMADIQRLAAAGNLPAAIERYRQAYGVDEQEARAVVETLQGGRQATASAPGMRPPEELTRALEDVQRLLKAGDKIGAIKVYREYFDVGLERAKYAVEQIEAGQTFQPETGFQALNRPMQVSQPIRRSGSRAGGIIITVILLFVAVLVAFILFRSSAGIGRHYNPETPLVLVPSGPAAVPQIAGVFYNPDADTRSIGLVDPATGKLLWQAAKLSGDGNPEAVATGPDLIYVANATDLLAYHKSDGSLAWQVRMSDKLNYGVSNLLVTAGRVITSNVDQTIQAYDAGTGHQVWTRRLSGYDSTLRLMGASLVVMDYTDSNNDYGLLFLDPAAGTQQNVITPACNYNNQTSNLDADSALIYDPAGHALYLVYDSSYGCVQRLDLASGITVWEADSQNNFSLTPDDFQALLTASTLYFNNGNDLMAVDKSSGSMKVLLTNPDYELLPLAVAGDNLIVRARRTRGTEIFQLWGVDTSSGSQVWQVDMQASSPIDPPNEMAGLIDDTGSGWTWRLATTGLVVVQFQAQPNQLVLETFNPATGASLSKQAIPLKNISGDFYGIPAILGWQGNIGYINIDSNMYSLDVSTGQLKVIY
jgi:outer membrane protein assembly factor BamB/ribosomal protein L7/L12